MAKKKRHNGHYCRICGELKSNESFSGKGHARHICKKCAALPLAEREEMGRMENLMRVIFKFPKSRKDWEIIERYAASNKGTESSEAAVGFLEEHSSHYQSKIAAKKKKTNRINVIKSKKEMKDLLEKIETAVAAFTKDATAQVENGNKAAGTRARKASLEVAALMKEFRKVSVEASKE